MTEELISFETAKLAKDKGFPQDVFNTPWYNRFGTECGRTDIDEGGDYLYYGSGAYTSEPKRKVSKEEYYKYTSIKFKAPTQSLLQKWLREKYDIHIIVISNLKNQYFVDYRFTDQRVDNDYDLILLSGVVYNTYEEALEKGLQEALKIV